MRSAPRVTVGLPVFNGERYLAKAVESVLAQDLPDFELLIADNGSTDATYEIALGYARTDDRVQVHRSQVNRGAAWNYNRLVDLARGHYFKWAAHDDLLQPEFLRRCVEVLDADPDVSLAYTRAADVDECGRRVRTYDLVPYATERKPSSRAASVLLDPSPCFESFGVTRRAQLAATGRIGPFTSSDRVLFLELALLGRFAEVPEMLFLHRQHPGRSVHAYADARDRNAWFDPRWEGRRSAPRWRLLREYARAIGRADLRPGERAAVAAILVRWCGQNRLPLARDAAAFLQHRVAGSSPRVTRTAVT